MSYRITFDGDVYHIQKFCILFNMESNDGFVDLGYSTITMIEEKEEAYLFYKDLMAGKLSEEGSEILDLENI